MNGLGRLYGRGVATKGSRTLKSKIGARIRALREERGLSLEDVAWVIRIGKPHLSLLERGERAASYELLAKIACRLGVLIADLVTFESAPRALLLEATRGLDGDAVTALLAQLTLKPPAKK